MSEDGSKGRRRTYLRLNCLPQLPGCLDIMVWWKSAQQPEVSRVWSGGSLLPCWLVTHAPVGYFRALAISSDVWGSSPSHRGVSTQRSLHLWLLFGCQSYSPQTGRRRGSSSSSKGKKAQEALASRLPCVFCFLLLPKSPVCTGAVGHCLFVVEAVILQAFLFLHCCHLACPSTVLTANVAPQHASPLKL